MRIISSLRSKIIIAISAILVVTIGLGSWINIRYQRTQIEGALEEGVKIEFLAAPVEVIRNNGTAVGARCIRMELGEPDKSGRPRPVPKPGSEFDVQATAIIAAISQEPDFEGFDGLHQGRDWIKADTWGATGVDGVYAGGDDRELGLVTIAISQGRFAAEAIDARFRGRTLESRPPSPCIPAEKVKLEWYQPAERHVRQHTSPDQRDMATEIEIGLSPEEGLEEAKRCMSCGMCMDCETCWMYCTNSCFVRLPKGEHYKVKLEVCNGCKKCADACPCGYIEMI